MEKRSCSFQGKNHSDFNEWLHAMKMVAHLPDGTPPVFRKKLWLALSEKYLELKKIDWESGKDIYFCDSWQEDDDELGAQIIKDLHRTGFSICSGPNGRINQGKLKKILIAYARWNPEVGYCQGFNMLGALILEVMEKEENDSFKVMLYLIEGILPSDYFNGSLSGLQVDMAVFRELMQIILPTLAQHLQQLQGEEQEQFCEPPLTNVFTMQWFLTMFCTCLPMNIVLRIWDMVLIEGSDVLLRAAIVIWSILEKKILVIKSADEFYSKMGFLSTEMLNGKLINSNMLIEKIVAIGQISHINGLRNKHRLILYPWKNDKKLNFYYSKEEKSPKNCSMKSSGSTIFQRRDSIEKLSSNKFGAQNYDRLALDVSMLKKQYDRFRDRQRQIQVVLASAVTRQANNTNVISITKTPEKINIKLLKKKKKILKTDLLIPKLPEIALKNSYIPAKLDASHSALALEKADHFSEFTFKNKVLESPLTMRRQSDSSSYSEDENDNSSSNTSLCDEEKNDCIGSCSSFNESSEYSNKSIVHDDKLSSDISLSLWDDSHFSDHFQTESSYKYVQSRLLKNSEHNLLKSDITNFKNISNEENTGKNKNKSYSAANNLLPTEINERIKTRESKVTNEIKPISRDIYCRYSNKTSDVFQTLVTGVNNDVKHSVVPHCVDKKGFTNTYFERTNSVTRPTFLELKKNYENPCSDSNSWCVIKSNGRNTSPKITYCLNNSKHSNTFSPENSKNLKDTENLNVPLHIDMANCEKKIIPDKSLTCNYNEVNIEKKEKDFLQKKKVENNADFFPSKNKNYSIIQSYTSSYSDVALQIIEENSKILGNILKKNFPENSVEISNDIEEKTFITVENLKSSYNNISTNLSKIKEQKRKFDFQKKFTENYDIFNGEHVSEQKNVMCLKNSFGEKKFSELGSSYKFSNLSSTEPYQNQANDIKKTITTNYKETICKLSDMNEKISLISESPDIDKKHLTIESFEENMTFFDDDNFISTQNTNLSDYEKKIFCDIQIDLNKKKLISPSELKIKKILNSELSISEPKKCKYCKSLIKNIILHDKICDGKNCASNPDFIIQKFQKYTSSNTLSVSPKHDSKLIENLYEMCATEDKIEIINTNSFDKFAEKTYSSNQNNNFILSILTTNTDIEPEEHSKSIFLDNAGKENVLKSTNFCSLTNEMPFIKENFQSSHILNPNASKFLKPSQENHKFNFSQLENYSVKETDDTQTKQTSHITLSNKFCIDLNACNKIPFTMNDDRIFHDRSNIVEQHSEKTTFFDAQITKINYLNSSSDLSIKASGRSDAGYLASNENSCVSLSVTNNSGSHMSSKEHKYVKKSETENLSSNKPICEKLIQSENSERDSAIHHRLKTIKDIIKSIDVICENKVNDRTASPLFIPLITKISGQTNSNIRDAPICYELSGKCMRKISDYKDTVRHSVNTICFESKLFNEEKNNESINKDTPISIEQPLSRSTFKMNNETKLYLSKKSIKYNNNEKTTTSKRFISKSADSSPSKRMQSRHNYNLVNAKSWDTILFC